VSISDEPLISLYADDPVVSPLLKGFARNLKIDVGKIALDVERCRWEVTSKFAHQLRGSTISYGFPELAGVFSMLEVETEKPAVDIALVNSLIKEVQNLSRRVN